ncbi:MAG: hypothetical protein H6592_03950 [Flavobacteriales bacterium]|nr:hypothetical protein [Flavobacteriales bacterium]
MKRPETLRGFVHRLNEAIASGNGVGPLDTEEAWEVGLEVAFYRDYVHALGCDGEHHIKKLEAFSQKRTFDLCLFGKEQLVVIEAKAHEGLGTKQMREFALDHLLLRKLIKPPAPEVVLIGLWSSGYHPRVNLKSFPLTDSLAEEAGLSQEEREPYRDGVPLFNGHLHWRDLVELPGITEDARTAFRLADAVKSRKHGMVTSLSGTDPRYVPADRAITR